ncbi:MAG: right-handed parallel beta-helix repeat-containing protein, partial [Elusimicrobia bacterium]|nr:right-handed parallel beta-helix repeat-containing protein [Elusimicrobiota bacterium]
MSVWNGRLYVTGGQAGSTGQSTAYSAPLNADGSVGSWVTETNSLPVARIDHAMSAWNGRLYVTGGGETTSAIRSTVYSAPLNAEGIAGGWGTQADVLPAGRRSHAMAAWNGRLYVTGGKDSAIADRAEVFSAPVNADASAGPWVTEANPLPVVLSYHAMSAWNGRLYVSGGFSGGAQNAVYSAPLNANGTVGSWTTEGTALPAARYGHAMSAWNGRLYVTGGNDGSNPQAAVYSAPLNADGSVGTWAPETNSLPAPRDQHAMSVWNGRLYVTGGKSGVGPQDTVYSAPLNADGSVGLWPTETNLPAPRAGHAMSVWNGRLYVTGGNSGGTRNTVYSALIGATGGIASWTTEAETLPAGTQNHAMSVWSGRLYLTGRADDGLNAFPTVFSAGVPFYPRIGTYYGPIIDLGAVRTVTSISWTQSAAPAGSSIQIDYAANTTGGALGLPWPAATNGAPLLTTARYLQYRITLTPGGAVPTPARDQTPAVSDLSIAYDDTPPQAVITSPANGAFVTSGVINGTAADPDPDGPGPETPSGLASVLISVMRQSDGFCWNGAAWGPACPSYLAPTGFATWTHTLAAGDLTDGVAYQVSAKATDNAGNDSAVNTATFVYDVSNPSIGITAPATPRERDLSLISGTAADAAPGQLQVVQLRVRNDDLLLYANPANGLVFDLADGNSAWFNADSAANWTNWSVSSGVPWVSGAPFRVEARSRDQAGNLSVAAGVSFVYDTDAPESGVTTPANNASVNALPAITGTLADMPVANPGAVIDVRARIQRLTDGGFWDGIAWGVTPSNLPTTVVGGNWQLSPAALPPMSSLSSGVSYYISSSGTDDAAAGGNIEAFDGVRGSTFTFDDTLPVATLATPAHNAFVESGFLSGGSVDTDPDGAGPAEPTGVASVQLSVRRESDLFCWDFLLLDWTAGCPGYFAPGGTPSNWNYTIPSAKLSNLGNYTATARATDNAGNVQTVFAAGTSQSAFTFVQHCETANTVCVPNIGPFPCASSQGRLQDAIDGADTSTGDRCILLVGDPVNDNAGGVTIAPKTFAPGARLYIQAYDGVTPVLDAGTTASGSMLDVQSDSVTLSGLVVRPNALAVQTGIRVAGSSVVLSGVLVDGSNGALLTLAGISLSSHTRMTGSSVTVAGTGVVGLLVSGSSNAIAQSSFTTNATSAGGAAVKFVDAAFNRLLQSTIAAAGATPALYLERSSWNVLSELFADDSGSSAVYFDGARYNTVDRSTVSARGGGTGLNLDAGSSSNTVSGSWMTAEMGLALHIINSAGNQLVSSSMTNGGALQPAMDIQADSTVVRGCYIASQSNGGLKIYVGGSFNEIENSTIAINSGNSALGLGFTGLAVANRIRNSLFLAPSGRGIDLGSGASFNEISGSTVAAGLEGIRFSNTTDNSVTASSITSSGSNAVYLGNGAKSNRIVGSTMTAAATHAILFGGTGGGENAIVGSVASSQGGNGARFDPGSSTNTIVASTITSAGASAAVWIGASSTTLAGSYIRQANTGSAPAAVDVAYASATRIDSSWIVGPMGVSVKGSTETYLLLSTVTGTSFNPAIRMLEGGSWLTIDGSSVTGTGAGTGISILSNAGSQSAGSIAITRNVVSGALSEGLSVSLQPPGTEVWVASNTFLPRGGPQPGAGLKVIHFNGLTSGATFQHNNVYWRSGGMSGAAELVAVKVAGSQGIRIEHNRISDPGIVGGDAYNLYGIRLDNSQRVEIRFNDFFFAAPAAFPAMTMISAENGSSAVSIGHNVFLSSAAAGMTARYIRRDAGTSLSSDYNAFFSSGAMATYWDDQGVLIDRLSAWRGTLSAFDRHSIMGDPRWAGTEPGQEDFHPVSEGGRWSGGSFSAVDGVTSVTIDSGDPALGVGAEQGELWGAPNLGSYGLTEQASGSYPGTIGGCPRVWNVAKYQSPLLFQPDTHTFTGAVSEFIPLELSTGVCIVARNATNFFNDEEIKLDGFVPGPHRIRIMGDPALATKPRLAPILGGQLALFDIRTASVSIEHLRLKPVNVSSYGIRAASASIVVASVTVEAGGPGQQWTVAAVSLSSFSLVDRSTITSADGTGPALKLTGEGSEVRFSTVTGTGSLALQVYGTTNAVVDSHLWSDGAVVRFEAVSASNTAVRTTIEGSGAGTTIVDVAGSSNVLDGVRIYSNAAQTAVALGGAYDRVIRSTITFEGLAGDGVVAGGVGESVEDTRISAPLDGVRVGGDLARVLRSTVATTGTNNAAIRVAAGSSATIQGCYAESPDNFTANPLRLAGGSYHQIRASRFAARSELTAPWTSVWDSTFTAANAEAMIVNADSITITGSVFRSIAGQGLSILSTDNTRVYASTFTSGGGKALWINDSEMSEVYDSYLEADNNEALKLSDTAHVRVQGSTMVARGGGSGPAVLLTTNVSSSTLLGVTIISREDAYGLAIADRSDYNSVIGSTIIGRHEQRNTGPGVMIWASSFTSLSGVYVQSSTGVWVSGSTGTTIAGSMIGADSVTGHALLADAGGGELTVSSSVLIGIGGGFDNAGVRTSQLTGSLSVTTSTIRGFRYGMHINRSAGPVWLSSNTVLPLTMSDSRGVFLNALAGGATVQDNDVFWRVTGVAMTSGFSEGVWMEGSANVALRRNRINWPAAGTAGSDGFIGVYVRSSPNAVVEANDIHVRSAGEINAYGLIAQNSSTGLKLRHNVFLSSMTAVSSATLYVEADSQAGFVSDYNDFFSSNALNTGGWGFGLRCVLPRWTGPGCPGQDANSIAVQPYWASLEPGAEDFHPLSARGRFPAFAPGADSVTAGTIDAGDPAEPVGNEPQPHGSRANLGSYGGTAQASMTAPPFGCDAEYSVIPGGPIGTYNSVQDAVNAVPITINQNACVIIRTAGNYDEFVSVDKAINPPYRLTIMADPALPEGSVFLRGPGGLGPSAFEVLSPSVSIVGIRIRPRFGVDYGLYASGSDLVLSSATVDSADAPIGIAAVYISSRSRVEFTNANATGGAGYLLTGEYAELRRSTATGTARGLKVNGSSHTVADSFFQSSGAEGAFIDGDASWTRLERSTFVSTAESSYGLNVFGGSTTVRESYIHSASDDAAIVATGASGTRIEGSTIAALAGGNSAVYVQGSSLAIVGSVLRNAGGWGLTFEPSAGYATIDRSTVTSGGASFPSVFVNGGGTHTFSGSYLEHTGGDSAAYFQGGTSSNTIAGCRIATAGGRPALFAALASSSTLDSSEVTNTVWRAVELEAADHWRILRSTLASGGDAGLYVQNSTGTWVSSSSLRGDSAVAAWFRWSRFSTIDASSATTSLGGVGFQAEESSATFVRGSYIDGQGGVALFGSTATTITGSRIAASAAGGGALVAQQGSAGLHVEGNELSAHPEGFGVSVSAFAGANSGVVALISNTIRGGYVGVSLGTMTAGSEVWVTSNTVLPTTSTTEDSIGIVTDGLRTGATIYANDVFFRATGGAAGKFGCGVCGKSSAGLAVRRNRVSMPDRFTAGEVLGMGFEETPGVELSHNDIHIANNAVIAELHGILLMNGSPGAFLRHNVLLASGTVTQSSATVRVSADSLPGLDSNYNAFFSSSGPLAFDLGGQGKTLAEWRLAGYDTGSPATHPRWAGMAPGAEDFHPRSQAGRWEGGSFTSDSVTAGTIDRGDPAVAVGDEPGAPAEAAPRVNLGSYGGTSQASKTPPPPTSFALAAVDVSSLTMTWNAVGATDGYLVEAAPDAGFSVVFTSAGPAPALATLAPQGLAID